MMVLFFHFRALQQKNAQNDEFGVPLLMELTFPYRRAQILAAVSLGKLYKMFPQLFTVEGLKTDFLRLHPGIVGPTDDFKGIQLDSGRYYSIFR